MSTIDRIVPVLARTVSAVAIITLIGASTAAYLFSEPRLAVFAAFALVSGAYAMKVTHTGSALERSPAEIDRNVRTMAA